MNNLHLAVQLFLQLGVILLFCRAVGAVAARCGQPQVVGGQLLPEPDAPDPLALAATR